MNTKQHILNLNKLQNSINYTFNNINLLKQSLTHRSYHKSNNERLEFIGDSILNYSVAKMLFDAFPKLPEGKLSRLRANLVNQDTLAEIAKELHIGDVLLLGTGELKSGGFNRPSILSDAVEALFAAISLDADFTTAEKVIISLYKERISKINLDDEGKDPKSLLQELLQSKKYAVPKYRIIKTIEHKDQQEFDVECDLGELNIITKATGTSRRTAERIAAQKALDILKQH